MTAALLGKVAPLFFLAHVPASIAAKKGRPGYRAWYLYGLVLFPVALIHALALKADFGRCPDCGGEVRDLGRRKGECAACGKRLARRDWRVAVVDGRARATPAPPPAPRRGVAWAVRGLAAAVAAWGSFMVWAAETERALPLRAEELHFALSLFAGAALLAALSEGSLRLGRRRARRDARDLEEAIAWERSREGQ